MPDNEITSAEELCRVLRRARLASEVTQDAVADAVGVTRQTLSQWEAGKGSPSPAQVRAWIAAAQPDDGDRARIAAYMVGGPALSEVSRG